MQNNIFTIKLLDVIIPPENEKSVHDKPVPGQEQREPFDKSTNIPGIFLVVSYIDQDLKRIFNIVKPPSFDMEHVKIILYNLMCSLHFL